MISTWEQDQSAVTMDVPWECLDAAPALLQQH